MRLGISPFASSREEVREFACAATQGGLDTLWMGDGYLANPDFDRWAGGMEGLAALAWLAGVVPGARVGISAAVLPLRDPVWLAKQANSLHQLADGGFVLVVTPGYWRQDIEAGGLDFGHRGTAFDDGLTRLLELLEDPSYSPGPIPSAPPVWLAGAEATMKRAIERRLPYQASRATPSELAGTAQQFFDAGGLLLAHRVRILTGQEESPGNQVDWNAVTGSVAEIVDSLGQFSAMGVSDLSIVPGLDSSSSRRTIEILVSEVLPQLV